MLVVKIELWPGGSRDKAREIARTYIINDGTGSFKRGNYKARVCKKVEDFDKVSIREQILDNKGILRTGEVKDYPRINYNVWRLVIRALRAAFPEEK